MVGSMIGSIVGVGLSILVFILILSGGIQMMRFKTWGLALTASILTFMPCNCPFFCIGIPLGIWAIIMLSLRDVREAFS
jgi:F0F1-type ATP synthase membrane subunit a